MAPECLSRKYGRPAFASDVYSVGVIFWEVSRLPLRLLLSRLC